MFPVWQILSNACTLKTKHYDTLCKLFLRLSSILSTFSATVLAWFSISCMAIGSIGGIQSGDCGYDLDIPEVTDVAMEEEAKLSILVILRSLDLRLLLTSLAVNISSNILKSVLTFLRKYRLLCSQLALKMLEMIDLHKLMLCLKCIKQTQG